MKTIFNIHFYFTLFFLLFIGVILQDSSFSPNIKEIFLQNLIAPPNVFLSLLSLTQHLLPLSSLHSLVSFFQFFDFHRSQFVRTNSQKHRKPIHTRTNSRFTTCRAVPDDSDFLVSKLEFGNKMCS